MASTLDKLSSNLDNLDKSCFTNTSRYYDGKQLELLLRKGVYPYEDLYVLTDECQILL